MKQKTLLVLAGGFGTRLRSVVSEVPKPLAPIADRPFLEYLIESWLEQRVKRLLFLLHHQSDLIQAFLASLSKQGRLQGCQVSSLVESQPLGTGGAIAYAVRQFGLSESFLVANADTWLGSGIKQVFETVAPAMGIVRVGNSERYGSVAIRQNRVIGFAEKQQSNGPGWINAGLYHLHADSFNAWDGRPFSVERELFPKLIVDEQLQAVPLQTDFIDIGIPDDYLRFNRWIESEQVGDL